MTAKEIIIGYLFQSTPLREGRPVERFLPARGKVSIHAPARGATLRPYYRHRPPQFQSTPLREGRPTYWQEVNLPLGFNPRPCARGDRRMALPTLAQSPFQSTPLREGRPMGPGARQRRAGFNPRPCARGDDCTLDYLIHSTGFQSTPLREGRRSRRRRSPVTWSFNPRPCARGDCLDRVYLVSQACFNPRPCARGDQCHPGDGNVHDLVSIHAPARGATAACVGQESPVHVSIHAPARGATIAPLTT